MGKENDPLEPGMGHGDPAQRHNLADGTTQPIPSDAPAPAAPPALSPPDGEPYRLGSVIGEGGMAVVYEAHDPALDRSVAVKVLKPELARDAELRARFLYEAKILGQMDHPGVVPVFTAGSLAGQGTYYAMKRVRGRTLRDILKGMRHSDFDDRGRTAPLIEIFEKVCQTVAYAHSLGILHRDLKPENIMVDEFGVVLVLDWGLSKKISAREEEQGILATEAGVVKGTPAYMSPEQARGSATEIDFRTDVFSLGIVLYELLTGSLPFLGQSRTQVMQEILGRDPSHPRSLNRRVSRPLAAICMKALSKDPGERYPSAAELAEDIRLYRDRLPISAYRPGALERLGNWVARHTAAAAAIGTALLLLLAFGGLLWHGHEAERIRKAEQADRDRLVAELDERRDREKLQKSMLDIRAAHDVLRGFDEGITELEQKKQETAPADAARLRELQHEIEQLETSRYMLSSIARSRAVSVITEFLTKRGLDFRQMDPEIVTFFRELLLQAIKAHVKRREYYKAHYYLWDLLRPDRETPVQWTDAQLRELSELKGQVEEKLRKALGPDIPLPDWKRFSDKMPKRKRE